MKESYWGYWLILLGVFIIGIMMLVNSTTTNSTQDYYSLKEITQASMVDALDFSYYRLYGDIKMSEQKFVENFIRRLADNTNLSNSYNVSFYDLYEVPPKVSVKITTKSSTLNIANNQTNYDVVNKIDEILEIGVGSSGTYRTVQKTKCYFDLTSNLMNYIKANLDKYPIIAANWSDTSSITSFKSAFVKQFPLLATTDYATLKSNPDYADFFTWVDKGWIKISNPE
jgi:hypothetical protein